MIPLLNEQYGGVIKALEQALIRTSTNRIRNIGFEHQQYKLFAIQCYTVSEHDQVPSIEQILIKPKTSRQAPQKWLHL
jgi:hypothetical protein